MSSIFDNPLRLSILTYLLIVIILITTRFNILFDNNGIVRNFGCKENSTYFNLPTVLYVSAIVITFVFQYINLKYK